MVSYRGCPARATAFIVVLSLACHHVVGEDNGTSTLSSSTISGTTANAVTSTSMTEYDGSGRTNQTGSTTTVGDSSTARTTATAAAEQKATGGSTTEETGSTVTATAPTEGDRSTAGTAIGNPKPSTGSIAETPGPTNKTGSTTTVGGSSTVRTTATAAAAEPKATGGSTAKKTGSTVTATVPTEVDRSTAGTAIGNPKPTTRSIAETPGIGGCFPTGPELFYGVNLTFPLGIQKKKTNSTEKCGNSSTSRATRLCTDGTWAFPVIESCFSKIGAEEEIGRLRTYLNESKKLEWTYESIETAANDLAFVLTQKTANVTKVIEVFELIIDAANVTQANVTESVIGVVSNIMNLQEDRLQEAIGEVDVITTLEEHVSNIQREPHDYRPIIQDNIGLILLRVDPNLNQNITFVAQTSKMSGDITKVYRQDRAEKNMDPEYASISLPPGIFNHTNQGDSGNVSVSFIIYKDAKLFQTGKPRSDEDASVRREILGPVVAVTVENANVTKDAPVEIRFPKVDPSRKNERVKERICVFYEPPKGGKKGHWSSEGCRLDSQTEKQIICICNHLTNFAVQVLFKADKAPSAFIVIGCCVTIIGLAIYITTILMYKRIRQMKTSHMRLNFAFNMLAFYVTFLSGVITVPDESQCRNFAAPINYFCLTTVSWLTAEAVFFYYKSVSTVQTSSTNSQFLPVSYVLAYGVPMVIVLLVFASAGEGTIDHCYLPSGSALYTGFLVELLILAVINALLFIALTSKILLKKPLSPEAEQKKKEIISRIQLLAIIWTLLGVSWIFGFYATGTDEGTTGLEAAFFLFASLQGLFLSTVACLRVRGIKREFNPDKARYINDLSDVALREVTVKSKEGDDDDNDMSATCERHETTDIDEKTEKPAEQEETAGTEDIGAAEDTGDTENTEDISTTTNPGDISPAEVTEDPSAAKKTDESVQGTDTASNAKKGDATDEGSAPETKGNGTDDAKIGSDEVKEDNTI